MLLVKSLVWDSWNIDHIARHGINQEEVTEICQRDPMVSKTYQQRLRAVGPTANGKILTVILAPKGDDTYYPVTARPASRKERRRYKERRGR